jgi:hypothetical protein
LKKPGVVKTLLRGRMGPHVGVIQSGEDPGDAVRRPRRVGQFRVGSPTMRLIHLVDGADVWRGVCSNLLGGKWYARKGGDNESSPDRA